eukprot:Gregarina_sp_Poly_1__2803@NODE_177_length_11964_cov_73_622174_g157_i0_p2_GENE_NODE_177_length_11964_cov_73_622174_g157_i0NODE_177_length_11964_cov_73_622174_g157_i0_p2_ORF_typecomplete_len1092_score228_14_NODE_177_length_11964_cov_73_622174_g157_i0868811483
MATQEKVQNLQLLDQLQKLKCEVSILLDRFAAVAESFQIPTRAADSTAKQTSPSKTSIPETQAPPKSKAESSESRIRRLDKALEKPVVAEKKADLKTTAKLLTGDKVTDIKPPTSSPLTKSLTKDSTVSEQQEESIETKKPLVPATKIKRVTPDEIETEKMQKSTKLVDSLQKPQADQVDRKTQESGLKKPATLSKPMPPSGLKARGTGKDSKATEGQIIDSETGEIKLADKEAEVAKTKDEGVDGKAVIKKPIIAVPNEVSKPLAKKLPSSEEGEKESTKKPAAAVPSVSDKKSLDLEMEPLALATDKQSSASEKKNPMVDKQPTEAKPLDRKSLVIEKKPAASEKKSLAVEKKTLDLEKDFAEQKRQNVSKKLEQKTVSPAKPVAPNEGTVYKSDEKKTSVKKPTVTKITSDAEDQPQSKEHKRTPGGHDKETTEASETIDVKEGTGPLIKKPIPKPTLDQAGAVVNKPIAPVKPMGPPKPMNPPKPATPVKLMDLRNDRDKKLLAEKTLILKSEDSTKGDEALKSMPHSAPNITQGSVEQPAKTTKLDNSVQGLKGPSIAINQDGNQAAKNQALPLDKEAESSQAKSKSASKENGAHSKIAVKNSSMKSPSESVGRALGTIQELAELHTDESEVASKAKSGPSYQQKPSELKGPLVIREASHSHILPEAPEQVVSSRSAKKASVTIVKSMFGDDLDENNAMKHPLVKKIVAEVKRMATEEALRQVAAVSSQRISKSDPKSTLIRAVASGVTRFSADETVPVAISSVQPVPLAPVDTLIKAVEEVVPVPITKITSTSSHEAREGRKVLMKKKVGGEYVENKIKNPNEAKKTTEAPMLRSMMPKVEQLSDRQPMNAIESIAKVMMSGDRAQLRDNELDGLHGAKPTSVLKALIKNDSSASAGSVPNPRSQSSALTKPTVTRSKAHFATLG